MFPVPVAPVLTTPSKVVCPDADKVVNAPAADVVPPIGVLLIVPPDMVDDVLSRMLKLSVAKTSAGISRRNASNFFMAYMPPMYA